MLDGSMLGEEGLLSRMTAALRVIGRRSAKRQPRSARRAAAFRLMYERFREILALNDGTLDLIADMQDRLSGQRGFSLGAIGRRARKAAMDVFVMVKNLNQIAEDQHSSLYGALRRISDRLESECASIRGVVEGPLVLPLAGVRAPDAPLVGTKMANLGEIAAECGLPVPAGFVITTSAFLRFMEEGELWEKCERLETILELDSPEAFAEACHEVQSAILATPIPAELAAAIRPAYGDHFRGEESRVAVRSSAVGEDTAASSHAGLYRTELNVREERLLDAYRAVVASAFSPTAVSYRFDRGLAAGDSLMAVGCVQMIDARSAGIIFSRMPDDPAADAVVLTATEGIAAGVAAGEEAGETWVLKAGETAVGPLLQPTEVDALFAAARKLETHFGMPQDIEWAVDQRGGLSFLQSRPAVAVRPIVAWGPVVESDKTPVLQGGVVVCPGVGSGPVVLVSHDEELLHFPDGGVLVARHSSPAFARVMARCAAILTDVGSPTGHMASLAREFGVPTLVGLNGATRSLCQGQLVTVDAGAGRVFDGILQTAVDSPQPSRSVVSSPALERLRRIAELVTPLHLTDPASPEFRPESCQSLHDITRFVHEKAYEVMFHYGDLAEADQANSLQLVARLPLNVRVFDLGGGIAGGKGGDGRITPEDIVGTAAKAFLQGLLEPRIRWDQPRPLSVRGLLSVFGESVAGSPAEAIQLGRTSYAIISDRYLNFSTKAGYHFSTVDTYCGQSQNKNYIHFRFNGGAADVTRRARRVRFLSKVLTALDFKVQAQGDLLMARLDKYSGEDIQDRLVALGRLTLCARQLDMLMDTESSPDIFAHLFLTGQWHKF